MPHDVESISTATETTISTTHTTNITGRFLLRSLSGHAASNHVVNQEPCVLQANLHQCRLHFHCPLDQAPAPLLIWNAQAPPPIVLTVNRTSFAPHISTPSLRQRRDLLAHATPNRHFPAQQRCASQLIHSISSPNSYTASWSPCKLPLVQYAQA